MKKLMLTVCLVFGLVIMAAPEVPALTVTIDRISGYYSGNGGEFNIVPSSWVGIGGYDASTLAYNQYNQLGFETFCVETQEYVSIPGTYNAVFNDKAMMGQTASGDPISRGTAWLYHEFQIQGDFDNYATYNYTVGADRAASAAALQATIWWLEGEAGDPGNLNQFRNAVITMFTDSATAMLDNSLLPVPYPVGVLNLYSDSAHTQLAQDQLYCAVPEPGILILLGIAMSAIGAASWRIRKL